MDPQAVYDNLIAKGYTPEEALAKVRSLDAGIPSNQQNPADSGSAAPSPLSTWTPTTPPATGSSGAGGVPSYVNVNDPLQKAIWDAFQKKGLTPRDQADFQFWVTKASGNGGWANEGNRNYWLARFDQSQGGVGDYAERPETGGNGGFDPTGSGLLDPYGGEPPPGFAPPPGSALPQPFSYQDFKAPTYEEAFNDPGYQFAVGEGERALENSAFGKGVGRTGGTLKDLVKYGQAAASTQYDKVLDRNLGIWGANLGNQSSTFGTNTNLAKDVYNRYKDFYTLGQNQFTDWQNNTFDKLYKQQSLGLNATQA